MTELISIIIIAVYIAINWWIINTHIYKVEHVGSKPLLDHRAMQMNSGAPQAWGPACTGRVVALC
jgi:hypothetical protein